MFLRGRDEAEISFLNSVIYFNGVSSFEVLNQFLAAPVGVSDKGKCPVGTEYPDYPAVVHPWLFQPRVILPIVAIEWIGW